MKYLPSLVLIMIILIAPVANAHGANSFQFIMRNGSVQPDDVQVSQNDSIGFNNVVTDLERTVTLENPNNSSHDWYCTASPYNSTGTDDECWLWLDPLNWSAGDYSVLVYSNDTLWQTVNITIILDTHNETTPSFNLPGGNIGQDSSTNNNSTELNILWLGVLFFVGAIFLKIKNKRIVSSSNDNRKGEQYE